ncbi:hypothetical protein ES707_13942 [subsurface metagenome]
MELQSWHIPITEERSFKEIKECLLSKGLISMVDEAGRVFQKFTEPLGISISFPLVASPFSDLLSRPDNDALCYFELIEDAKEAQWLNLIIASKNESAGSQLLADCQSVLGQEKVIKGTIQEEQIAESFREHLKEGTHGRLLSDPDFTSSLDILYDPVIRKQLRQFDIFGDSAISGALIEDLIPEVGGLKKSEVRRLINDEKLFSKQFSIGCNNCGASTLVFSTKEGAQAAFTNSTSRKCFRCNKDLQIVETFTLGDAILKGLTQGFWLEYLVHRIVQPKSMLSVAGIVMENFELDVVSLTCEKVILYECKDSSFGERDFWMSVPKAQRLDADILWIVTTEPVHENVKKAIEWQKEQARFEIFIIENLADQQSIESAISERLDQVRNDFLANVFIREPDLYRYPLSLRRRLLRRRPTRF